MFCKHAVQSCKIVNPFATPRVTILYINLPTTPQPFFFMYEKRVSRLRKVVEGYSLAH